MSDFAQMSDAQLEALVPSELRDLPRKAKIAWLDGMFTRKGGARQEKDRFKGPSATSIIDEEKDKALTVQRGTLVIDLFKGDE